MRTESRLARAFRAKIEAANLSKESAAKVIAKLNAAKKAYAEAGSEAVMNSVGSDIIARGGSAI